MLYRVIKILKISFYFGDIMYKLDNTLIIVSMLTIKPSCNFC